MSIEDGCLLPYLANWNEARQSKSSRLLDIESDREKASDLSMHTKCVRTNVPPNRMCSNHCSGSCGDGVGTSSQTKRLNAIRVGIYVFFIKCYQIQTLLFIYCNILQDYKRNDDELVYIGVCFASLAVIIRAKNETYGRASCCRSFDFSRATRTKRLRHTHTRATTDTAADPILLLWPKRVRACVCVCISV